MRTDTLNKVKLESSDDSSQESKEVMKVVRKTLHPLQVAAGDKENLVGAGRVSDVKMISGNKQTNSPKKDKKKVVVVQEKSSTVTAEDLTTEGEPGEGYWKALAETRRKALEKTLKENEQLHERLQALSEQNEKYKDLLEEAQGIIDTLNEVINEINTDDSRLEEEEPMIRRP